MINDSVTFYNAGGAIKNIYQFDYFINKISFSPQLFIINIDQWFFNKNYDNQLKAFNKKCYDNNEIDYFRKSKMLLQDLFKGKIVFSSVFDPADESIGLNAKINKNGFTADGSYYYGNFIMNPQKQIDYNFQDTYLRIDKGVKRFQYGDHADTSVLETIESFLNHCKEKNISVIAILPPFAPKIYQKMIETGNYNYMSEIYDMLNFLFSKYENCWIYDYTDMSSFGVHNYNFIDGFHGDDLIYNMLLLDIIRNNPKIRRFFKNEEQIIKINKEYMLLNIKYHVFE